MKNRFVKDIPLQVPAQEVESLMEGFLYRNGFYKTDWNKEACWAADRGICEKYRLFLYSYENGVLHIEAWLRAGKTKEYSLNGWGAMNDRQTYLELMKLLIEQVLALLPQDSGIRVEDVLSEEDKRASKRYRIVWPLVVLAALILMALPHYLK